MKWINKKEIKYIGFSVAFALIWFIFALPYLTKTLDGNSPYLQFFFFNIGLYVILFLALKAVASNKAIPFKTALALTIMFMAMDIMMPEYHVMSDGTLIQGASLGVSASDYSLGLLAHQLGWTFNIFGVSFVYIFTYVLAPLLLLLLSAKLLPNFVEKL